MSNNKHNFTFLREEYPEMERFAELAERSVYTDPSNTITKARLVGELIAKMVLEYETKYEELDRKQVDRIIIIEHWTETPKEIIDLFHLVRKSGNDAAHQGDGDSRKALFILKKLFKLSAWFIETYDGIEIDDTFVVPEQVDAFSIEEIKAKENELSQKEEELKRREEKLKKLAELSEEQKEAQRKERVKRSLRATKRQEENEAETRERIDQQLREAGWECDTPTLNYKHHKTMPDPKKNRAIAEWRCGTLWADYALFIGEQLVGIVEAKKHNTEVMSCLGQARDYSEAIKPIGNETYPLHANSEDFKIPFIFSSNGRPYLEQLKEKSGIWFWDARNNKNPKRALPSWFTPDDLKKKLLFDEDKGAEKLQKTDYELLSDPQGLNLRDYQIEAIKALENKIINFSEERKALIAMATGTGKTRTILGMCYRLIKAKRFSRILFLVDRTMLGNQAADTFNEVRVEGLQTFAQIYDLKALEDKAAELDTKIHFATVQSMVKRIDEGNNPPSVGAYDCIIVDEAHRGYTLDRDMEELELSLYDQKAYQSRYRMVLDYFDAYRIGLTATPAIHTQNIFGEPVFTYSYRRAVVEGHLIDFEPPIVFKTKYTEEGLKWEKGDDVEVYDPESGEIVVAGVAEDEIKVDVTGFNKRVITRSFNQAILHELLDNPDYEINLEGKKKTLIFAASDSHADSIVEILNEKFRELDEAMGGDGIDKDAVVKITGSVADRVSLLKNFKNEQYPNIVVTVDLLTTGIDVPSICNLVFLRRVNSRILYDQMIGRATRKCEEIKKDVFRVFDAVGVTEIMAEEETMKPVAPLVSKTFKDLVGEIEHEKDDAHKSLKIDRIVAKLQRKVRKLDDDQQERFEMLSECKDASALGKKLRALPLEEQIQEIEQLEPLWEYLDKNTFSGRDTRQIIENDTDEFREAERAYSNKLKPKDYIESFVEYIQNNRNRIEAINVLCTRPQSLTRKDLKEIRFALEEKGFTNTSLNTAYKETNAVEIAADIISYIRMASLGTTLVSHEERIKGAVDKLRRSRKWNSVQMKWIERFEKQLMHENIITMEDLNKPPFVQMGVKGLQKIFNNEIESVIEELNEHLYA